MKEGVNLLYESVVVNLGARCNASCEHCCFSCSPTKKEALDKNEVINLVENKNYLFYWWRNIFKLSLFI